MAFKDNNPFRDDVEEDDFEEIRDSEIARIRQEKQFYQNRIMDSSERSIRAIADSERLAVETEMELSRQGEALDRTEQNLDKMQGQMKQADRHVTSLKSIWGTIGNYFRKAPSTDVQTGSRNEPQTDVNAQAERSSKDDKYGRRDEPQRIQDGPRLVTSYERDHEYMLNRNLDDISTGLSSLKQHALALGDTIESHNDQIERIAGKADNMDKNVEDTNKRIRKILQ